MDGQVMAREYFVNKMTNQLREVRGLAQIKKHYNNTRYEPISHDYATMRTDYATREIIS